MAREGCAWRFEALSPCRGSGVASGANLLPESPMEIILYYAPNACSLVPYVTLTEADAKFEVRTLNFRKHQQMSADYLKLNPKHKVPFLVVDGRSLSENVAIQTWVARQFPQTRLL